MLRNANRPTALVATLLLGSGFCALAYQVVWFREFRLVFGASTAASAAVLAVFMGGIGLGGALLGQKADKHPSPLRLYGWLELGVAVAAALSPALISLTQSAYIASGGQSVLGLWGATAARLGLACVVLGLPTFLMGGTLPAAVRAATREDDRSRHATALLYGVNTLGAVLGAAMSTFVLLPAMSTHSVLWLACGLNTVVGLVAVLAAPRNEMTGAAVESGSSGAAAPQITRSSRELPDFAPPEPAVLVYSAACVVGFAFFLMELVWYRMLGPILGGTTYTFGLILVVALLGIGIGGALYSFVLRRVQPSALGFGLTCGLEALFVAAPYALGDRLAILAYDLRQDVTTFAGEVSGWFVVAAIVVLPAAVVAGAQFPLLIALAGRGRQNVGRHVGVTYAWNTAGAIAGSLAGGFGLLPILTAPGAWVAVVLLLSALCAASLVHSARGRLGWGLLPPALTAGLAVLLVAFSEGPTAVWRHSGIGAGRATIDRSSPNATRAWVHSVRRDTIWEAEGVEASVAINVGDGLSFYVNGKADGNAVGDVGTQVMLGVLPALLHPDPSTAMVVGMGTGETAGWLAETPGMQRVDVVELEHAIDDVARRCALANHDVMRHPKVRRIYNDAREVLLTTPERYDIISSEPSNPYRAGIAGLFTREFYLAARNRLRDRGLFVQWLQGYEVDDRTVRIVFATLSSVFPHIEVWQSKQDDMLLVCSTSPMSYDGDRLHAKLAHDSYREAVAVAWRAVDLEGIAARFIADSEFVRDYGAREAGAENTDSRNRIEYMFARSLGRSTDFSIEELRRLAAADGRDQPPTFASTVDWSRVLAHRQLNHALIAGAVNPIPSPDAEQQARTNVLARYWVADTAGMTAAWEEAGYEPIFPTETALLALAYANQGNDRARELAVSLARFSRSEALAIVAYLECRHRSGADPSGKLLASIETLQDTPWMLSHVAELVLLSAGPAAAADPAAAPRLWAALNEPFALYAFGPEREAALMAVSPLAGLPAAADFVQSLEPFIPWTEAFLSLRVQVYQQTANPLLGQARGDLAKFRDAKTAGAPLASF